jgi:hypothetical protein
VNSPLSGIPIGSRRRLAATVGLFAVLFGAVGVVSSTGTTPGIVRVFAAIALIVAVLLGVAAWGVAHSVRLDLAEERLDKVIDTAIDGAAGTHAGTDLACGCGHDHDADEMHVSDEPCAPDGAGTECTHSCDTCVLASLRQSPPRGERLAQ